MPLNSLGYPDWKNGCHHNSQAGSSGLVRFARRTGSPEPQLLLLDEPLNNLLTPIYEKRCALKLKRFNKKIGVIFYVTHDQEIALAIADRVAVMDAEGKLRRIGTPEEIYEQHTDDYVFRFLGVANFLPARRDGEKVHIAGESGMVPSLIKIVRGMCLAQVFAPAM